MRDIANVPNHIALFHQKIFNPSIIPKGIRLKIAIKAFIHAPKIAIVLKSVFDVFSVAPMNRIESAMLVKGPERAVFPTVFFVACPAIITAPGEIILNNGRNIETRVISAPDRVSRNSAHNP